MSDKLDVCEINDGHIIEALDRLHVACSYIEDALGGHALLSAVPEFRNEVDKAVGLISKLYQEVGSFDSIKDLANAHTLSDGFKAKD